MGQRLVIKIEKQKQPVLAVYYHWSAYTKSACIEMEKVLDCIKESDSGLSLIYNLKRYGIRLDMEDAYCFVNKYGIENNSEDLYTGNDRNIGIIVLAPGRVEDIMQISDGDITINLDDGTFTFNVLWDLDIDDLYGKDDPLQNIVDIPFSLDGPIPLEDFHNFSEFFFRTDYKETIRDSEGNLFSIIE